MGTDFSKAAEGDKQQQRSTSKSSHNLNCATANSPDRTEVAKNYISSAIVEEIAAGKFARAKIGAIASDLGKVGYTVTGPIENKLNGELEYLAVSGDNKITIGCKGSSISIAQNEPKSEITLKLSTEKIDGKETAIYTPFFSDGTAGRIVGPLQTAFCKDKGLGFICNVNKDKQPVFVSAAGEVIGLDGTLPPDLDAGASTYQQYVKSRPTQNAQQIATPQPGPNMYPPGVAIPQSPYGPNVYISPTTSVGGSVTIHQRINSPVRNNCSNGVHIGCAHF